MILTILFSIQFSYSITNRSIIIPWNRKIFIVKITYKLVLDQFICECDPLGGCLITRDCNIFSLIDSIQKKTEPYSKFINFLGSNELDTLRPPVW